MKITKNIFSQYNRSNGWLYVEIGSGLLVLIILLLQIEKLVHYLLSPTFSLPALFLLIFVPYVIISFFQCIYRVYIVRITFDEDKIVYKSPFKKIELEKCDVENICIVKTAIRQPKNGTGGFSLFSRQLVSFNESYSDYSDLTENHFIQIGLIKDYPTNISFLYLKSVTPQYITLQYQDGLEAWLKKYDPKQIYKDI